MSSATRAQLLQRATERLTAAGISSARRNAEWLLMEVLGCRRAALYASSQTAVAEEEVVQFWTWVERRAEHEPLQYILGYTEFYGLRMAVSPSVLIPRPETEEVVEEGLRRVKAIKQPRMLDVGTGSGCIALALQHERPNATVWACDVSMEALAAARANAEALAQPVHFFQADVLHDALEDAGPTSLDLVISNPPYIPDIEADSLSVEVREHEPGMALFTGDDPLRFYRALAHQAPAVLVRGGWLVLETHADHAAAVRDVLAAHGFTPVQVHHDLSGRPRIVCGQYQAATGS